VTVEPRPRSLPLARPYLDGRELELVGDVLRSGTLSLGPMTRRFERLFAERVGRRFAVACSSGTGGLHAALHQTGVGPGDEVITPSFSFIASANVILFERATPVFVDVDDETLTIDPGAIEASLTERTRAILPVHIFGHPCDMGPIMNIARRHGLHVVEDACEALMARRDGAVVGGDGNTAVYAFYANKPMTTGEGGVVTTDDEEEERVLRSLLNQGRVPDGSMRYERLGFNYRMSDITAAVGVAQIEKLDFLLAQRARVAQSYTRRLAALDGVRVPTATRRVERSWFVYPIRLAPGIDRDAVAAALARRGIATRPYMPAIHLQPDYVARFGYRRGMLPITEAASDESLVLPFFIGLTDDDIDAVASALEASIVEVAT
jgi:perosamine synthetase